MTATPLPGRTASPEPADLWVRRGRFALGAFKFLTVLYAFLLSITLISTAFKALGADFAMRLCSSTENPFIGLFIGILATSIVQSSSATTSIVVGMVAADTLNIPNAIPIIMGANIGTTVTAVLVSMGHIRRKEEFRRAFGGALVHEVFKLVTVLVLFPVELATRFLERTSCALAEALWGSAACDGASLGFKSPLKAILDPAAKMIVRLFTETDPAKVSVTGVVLLLVISLVALFGSLWLITKMMRRAVVGRAESLIDRTIGRAPFLGLLVGLVLTAVVQSSSAVTSILVPLAGAGVLTLEQIFLIALGSCLGTTVTGLLAALAVGPAGLAIALAHVLFNLTGIALIYPIPRVRALPVRFARWFADIAAEAKHWAIAYVVGTFFVVPGGLIFLTRLFSRS
ncbi:MAG: Na/Pi symporter [Planctomycetota bacterium]